MKITTVAAVLATLPIAATAQTVAAAAASSTTVDLTSVINTVIVGVVGVASTVFLAWLQSHMKDKQAAAVVSTAVQNSLGAIQQAGTAYVTSLSPQVRMPGVSPELALGVQYVLNNAGPEMQRLGITPEGVAAKIAARIGLANVQTNLAATSSATPAVAKPLDPVVSVATPSA